MKAKSLVSRVLAPVIGLAGVGSATTVSLVPTDGYESGAGIYGVGVSGDKVFAATEGGVQEFTTNLSNGVQANYISGSDNRDFGARDENSGFFVDNAKTAGIFTYGNPIPTGLSTNVLATTSSFSNGNYAFLMNDNTISVRDSNNAILEAINLPTGITQDMASMVGLGAYESESGAMNYMVVGKDDQNNSFGRHFSTFGNSVLDVDENRYRFDGSVDLSDVDFLHTGEEGLSAIWGDVNGGSGLIAETDFTSYALNSQIPQDYFDARFNSQDKNTKITYVAEPDDIVSIQAKQPDDSWKTVYIDKADEQITELTIPYGNETTEFRLVEGQVMEPTVATLDRIAMEAVATPNTSRVTFNTTPGVTYAVQFSPDLNNWERLPSFKATGFDGSEYHPTTEPQMFYRVGSNVE